MRLHSLHMRSILHALKTLKLRIVHMVVCMCACRMGLVELWVERRYFTFAANTDCIRLFADSCRSFANIFLVVLLAIFQ